MHRFLRLALIASAFAWGAPAAAAPATGGRVFSTRLPGGTAAVLLGVAVGADGTVWVSDQSDDALISIHPDGRRQSIRLGRGALRDVEDRASDVWPVGTVFAAPDGSVYVSEHGALARVTGAGVQTVRIPGGPYASPGAFTAGPDGAIWFTEVNRPQIGRFDPVTSAITDRPDGAGADRPAAAGIASGPDGRLWYTLPSYDNGRPGELGAMSTAGVTSVYTPRVAGLFESAVGIAADGRALWVLGSQSGQAPRGQLQSGLIRVVPGAGAPSVTRVGPGLGDAAGNLAPAPGGMFYAVGGALGASGNIVSITEAGVARHFGHANGQVALFASGANVPALAAAADGTVWLGADGGVLEHLLPTASTPCVVPRVVGLRYPIGLARLRQARCAARTGPVRGPADTPGIVTAQATRPDTVLDPGSTVTLRLRRGVLYACDPSGDTDPTLAVLRVSCASALDLFHRIYDRATARGTARSGAFSCHFVRGTAVPAMGGGEVDCHARDRRHRLRLVHMFWTPPR